MTIYFAHSLEDYGTPASVLALQRIRRLLPGHAVMNPENLNWRALEEAHGRLGVYGYVIRRCARVVVLEREGVLGRGAALECELALKTCKPVHVLRDRRLLEVRKIMRLRDSENWVRFARVCVRPPEKYAARQNAPLRLLRAGEGGGGSI